MHPRGAGGCRPLGVGPQPTRGVRRGPDLTRVGVLVDAKADDGASGAGDGSDNDDDKKGQDVHGAQSQSPSQPQSQPQPRKRTRSLPNAQSDSVLAQERLLQQTFFRVSNEIVRDVVLGKMLRKDLKELTSEWRRVKSTSCCVLL